MQPDESIPLVEASRRHRSLNRLIPPLIRLLAGLALLPLLSGCMTSNTLLAINHPQPRYLQDHVDHWAGASLTQSNQLLIFFEAHLTNSPQRGKYTIIVPLSDVKIYPYRENARQTNSPFSWGVLRLKRSAIHDGWIELPQTLAQSESVPVGPLITNTWELHIPTDAAKMKTLEGQQRTLYPIVDAKTNSVSWPEPPRFIYIDATHPEAFTHIEMEEVWVPVNNDACYALLPLAVAGDVATLPCQFLFLIFWFCAAGRGTC